MNTYELYHYGTLGQKWGIRRYQNEDGSYKPGAEGRYAQKTIGGPKKNISTSGSGTTSASQNRDLGTLAKSRAAAITKKNPAEEKQETQNTSVESAAKTVNQNQPAQQLQSAGTVQSSSTKKKKNKKKGYTFKVNDLFDKIDGIDLDKMTDVDRNEIDNLIMQYNFYKVGKSATSKKMKAIDAFIEQYNEWKGTHPKKAEQNVSHSGVLRHWGIKGMHWGIRRYQNSDGTLTEEGKKRYNREVLRNNQRPKDKRVKDEALKDPTKWAKDDLTNTKTVVDSSKTLISDLDKLEKATRRKKENPRLDLSNMSDDELRKKINRELLERQYNQVFNEADVDRGRANVNQILETAGGLLSVASSALGIALAIQQLRKG